MRALIEREGSTRSAALLRIGLALIAWSRWAGLLAPWAQHSPAGRAIGAVFFVASALMLAGLGSRFATAATGLTLLVLHFSPRIAGADQQVHYHTYLLGASIALLALAPCGRSLSADRWLAVRRGTAPEERGPLWALTLIALQASAAYFWSAIDKTGMDWLSGMRLEQVALLFYGGTRIPGAHAMWVALAWSTVAVEMTLAFGLWHARARRFLVPAGLTFHAAIYLTFPVETFSVTIALLYLAFLDPASVDRATR